MGHPTQTNSLFFPNLLSLTKPRVGRFRPFLFLVGFPLLSDPDPPFGPTAEDCGKRWRMSRPMLRAKTIGSSVASNVKKHVLILNQMI